MNGYYPPLYTPVPRNAIGCQPRTLSGIYRLPVADLFGKKVLTHHQNTNPVMAIIDGAGSNRIVVLQFHGVPDLQHPWVNTPPELFKQFMNYLKEKKFQVVALGDIEPLLPRIAPADPLLHIRYPPQK